ncbi:hypothetical protein [Nocardia sp. NPDC020380]|uniref:hypothetical protein n=1 Tax=Nocardia sp. NPDC020380 TaxID=3364309 RepID=UPI0037A22548
MTSTIAISVGVDQGRRIGIANVVSDYGLDAVYRRIAQLRATGMHYAAVAIEHELAVVSKVEPRAS